MGTIRYHTNDEGNTLRCRAETKKCRFVHGSTAEEAADNWQQLMTGELLPDSQQAPAAAGWNDRRFFTTFLGEDVEALPLALPMDEATRQTVDRLIDAGFSPLIVGGAVRDGLLGNSPKDFDIEVHGAKSFTELRRAVKGLGEVNLTGKSFGVMKLRVKLDDGELSEEIDLSLPRRDSKIGEGHRGFAVEVDPEMGIKEASARRDLTVNALLWDPQRNLAIDAHGGFDDMKNGVLRHVSSAFSEDPLRVIRVARFASKLGFDTAEGTVALSKELEDKYSELAKDRISGEMGKMILQPHPEKGLKFLRESGWGAKMGLQNASLELGEKLKRGRAAGAQELKTVSEQRVLQLAVIAADLRGKHSKLQVTLENFAATKAEAARGLAISTAPSVVGLSKREAKQWAWDNQKITARERLLLDGALNQVSSANQSRVKEQLFSYGVLDRHEDDRFDAAALIKEHKEANPGLRDGPWIRELMQKHRDAQYSK